jgi:hypothetical protein
MNDFNGRAADQERAWDLSSSAFLPIGLYAYCVTGEWK